MTDDVDTGAVNTPEQKEEKPCIQCLVPEIMTAWNSARGACEFVKDDEGKKACREEMEKMAGDIKNIKDGSEVIYNAIKSSSNPADFIQAQIAFARTHNEINVKAILKWADEMEASGKTIDPETAQVVKFYRLQESTQI